MPAIHISLVSCSGRPSFATPLSAGAIPILIQSSVIHLSSVPIGFFPLSLRAKKCMLVLMPVLLDINSFLLSS